MKLLLKLKFFRKNSSKLTKILDTSKTLSKIATSKKNKKNKKRFSLKKNKATLKETQAFSRQIEKRSFFFQIQEAKAEMPAESSLSLNLLS